MLTRPIHVPVNRFLQGPAKEISLENIRALRNGFVFARDRGVSGETATNLTENLLSVDDDHLSKINSRYSSAGLFGLIFMAQTSSPSEFLHFHRVIKDNLVFLDVFDFTQAADMATGSVRFEPDNDRLRCAAQIDEFNHNVLHPDLARKIYNPGKRAGYMVYGLGGPRILVSHPFRGWSEGGSLRRLHEYTGCRHQSERSWILRATAVP